MDCVFSILHFWSLYYHFIIIFHAPTHLLCNFVCLDRLMMTSAAWSAKLSFWKILSQLRCLCTCLKFVIAKVVLFLTVFYSVIRGPQGTKIQMSHHLHMRLLLQCPSLGRTFVFITAINGPKQYLVFVLMNGTSLHLTPPLCIMYVYVFLQACQMAIMAVFVFWQTSHCSWKCKRPGHLAEDCLVMTSSQVVVMLSLQLQKVCISWWHEYMLTVD